MATLDITQFFSPTAPDNVLQPADLIHLGRPTNATGEKDIALTGAAFFNSINRYGLMYGAPTAPTSLTNGVVTPITGYQNAGLGIASPSTSAGTFTITTTAIYRINFLVAFSCSTRDVNLALIFQNSRQPDLTVDGTWLVNGGGDIVQFSANFMTGLGAGNVINMGLTCDKASTITSYATASFDITAQSL